VNTATVSYTNQANTSFTVSATVKTTVTEVIATPTITPRNLTVAPGQRVANNATIGNNGNWVEQFDIPVPSLAYTPNASGGAVGTATLVGVYVNPIATATSTTFAGIATAIPLAASTASTKVTPYIDSANNASSAGIVGSANYNASAAAVLAALPAYTDASGTVVSGIYPNNTVIFFVYDIPANASASAILTKTVTIVPSKDSTKTPGPKDMIDTVQAPTLDVYKGVANIGNASTTAYAGTYATTATGAPGDVLEYVVTIKNTGNASATAVALTDAIDANTTLLDYTTGAPAATVTAATYSVTYTNAGTTGIAIGASTVTNLSFGISDSATALATGSVDNGATITIKYRVKIN
jgi:uncharacterized repeat protein (TIGR01451 family)